MTAGPLVLGLDVGGSTTRVLVADLAGRILGTARGSGGNPVSNGEPAALRAIAGTLREALAAVDPAGVAAGVLGLAGGLSGSPALAGLWPAAGLPVAPRLTGDVELAYAAGTSGPDGTALIGGTGAVAAEVRAFAAVRTADGHGWLLGDRGSGYWLGRAAVRTTLAAVDRGAQPAAGLLAEVLDTLLPDRPAGAPGGAGLRAALIGAVHAQPPVRLARLAPLVLDAARAGDQDAGRLVEQAADHLLDTLAAVREPGSGLPVVLAGGVLGADSPLAAAVRRRVVDRWPDAVPVHAGDGAGAAAWLAARTIAPPATDLTALHRRLVAGAARSRETAPATGPSS
ncbi:BadF/BadG/BcrA/BcrD ATPase family protein [Kitasatospora sp. NPDC049258]|uniref:N-acetylglucosamine kinase n=1 Tax=Kitasatospora sp. NPDC049258 TaxID=3155394 RepID=UPI00344404C1